MSSKKFEEISQEQYEELFKISNFTCSELRKNALKTALEIRKFEIELYWKRATYFWTFIGAALTGFIAVQQFNATEKIFWSVLIGCLGFVFSVAWYCVNRGSKQWQENWENHVDLLEDGTSGPLYKVVTTRPEFDKPYYHPKGVWERTKNVIIGPGPFSVSKINQIVSLFIIFLWIGLVIKVLPPIRYGAPLNKEYATIIIFAVIMFVVILSLGRTDNKDYKDIKATKRTTKIKQSVGQQTRQADAEKPGGADAEK